VFASFFYTELHFQEKQGLETYLSDCMAFLAAFKVIAYGIHTLKVLSAATITGNQQVPIKFSAWLARQLHSNRPRTMIFIGNSTFEKRSKG